MLGNSLRGLVKRFLKGNPQRFAALIYHATRWGRQYIKFKSRSDLRGVALIKHSRATLADSRNLGFRSQFGQDLTITERYLELGKPGTFVDIGANDPLLNNNTYYLEQKLGWKGIAVEPMKSRLAAWEGLRSAKRVNAFVSEKKGQTLFREYARVTFWEDQLSCAVKYARPEDSGIPHNDYLVPTETLGEILCRAEIKAVDLLCIDVEGAEVEVLEGIDFSSIRPRLILIENKFGSASESLIREILRGHGYRLDARVWTSDDIFVDAETGYGA